ncbi:hypothetical protein SAMN05660690_0745 [Geodermatophilus telluris]|uniref:Entry exclusion lipoprotein TrbK n=1 Tax=Geodermatophilus telluris TaxID=1190417 RepID=A0A1G6JAL4_9ACTN|nr:hypothetical protein [Geodermatophilus telluris]SDC15942.1 hypothetical protein SAMN05660690_0745 [Geodermatophilus telluris]
MRELIAIGLIAFALTACAEESSPASRYQEEQEFLDEYLRCTDAETGAIIEDRHDDCHLDG